MTETITSGCRQRVFACASPAAAWRLSALADGLSGYVLLAASGLPRPEALSLLHDAARAEIEPPNLAAADR